MKRITILMLCLSLLLCGCGSAPAETTAPKTQETTAPAATTVPETTVPETTVPETTVPETTVEETDPVDNARMQAESCIDKTVEELFQLVGEPASSDYAPSCLGDGEDGILYYEDFIVYTYREGDTETVTFVE